VEAGLKQETSQTLAQTTLVKRSNLHHQEQREKNLKEEKSNLSCSTTQLGQSTASFKDLKQQASVAAVKAVNEEMVSQSQSRSMNEQLSSRATNGSSSLFERRNRVSEVEQMRSRRSIETEEESIRRESFNTLSSAQALSDQSMKLNSTKMADRQGTTFGEATMSYHQHRSSSSSLSTQQKTTEQLMTHGNLTSSIASGRRQHQATSSSDSSFNSRNSYFSSSNSRLTGGKASFLAGRNRVFDGDIGSPDFVHLVHENETDFAKLMSALDDVGGGTMGFLLPKLSIPNSKRHQLNSGATLAAIDYNRDEGANSGSQTIERMVDEANSTIKEMAENPPTMDKLNPNSSKVALSSSLSNENSQRIRDLLSRANSCTGETARAVNDAEAKLDQMETKPLKSSPTYTDQSISLVESRRKAVLNESIVRIDQRMGELCQKLQKTDCRDTQNAIDLLTIMIQMIEKAWSVPVCGDDLGFKLCNSLREAGGLDIILASIYQHISKESDSQEQLAHNKSQPRDSVAHQNSSSLKNGKLTPLKLNLTTSSPKSNNKEIEESELEEELDQKQVNDNDSDTFTSDLGLDSASVESLSYVTAATTTSVPNQPKQQQGQNSLTQTNSISDDPSLAMSDKTQHEQVVVVDEDELDRMKKEELVFLSARLLSQCLTSDNRDYIVRSGQLDSIIQLACKFATMKSKQSERLLKQSALMTRQSSSMKLKKGLTVQGASEPSVEGKQENLSSGNTADQSIEQRNQRPECLATSDVHSAIGTEILQHLFKHSEETCSRMISLGALQAILYGCRLSHTETLRHCASALANLALYGGSDSQQTMIEQKAHVWLFPLAFNDNDNVQYYACLAIVVLAANQEIEADVLKSGTLDLVEPFVTTHEPRQFAESTVAHIHGQSSSWLRKLIPLLESKREEAKNLACFHFAMEAYIKREQGQTELFKEIGAVEALRRAASSPIAIASRFACQALRLIGEKEPHKLSQQVPLWTCEDVCEWVGQIGFEKYRAAFKDSHVDGDLLLQLDEEMLRFDLGLENGILRRRFMRELGNLKRIADYSSVDRSNLAALLIQTAAQALEGARHHHHHLHHHQMGQTKSSTLPCSAISATVPAASASASSASSLHSHRDFVQYIYPILQLGVTRDNIHLIDCDHLLAECKITNALHRIKLAHSIRDLQDRIIMEAQECEEERQRALAGGVCEQISALKTLDVFVSYRRATGSQLASLLKVHLQLRGFSVFIDVERLEAGKFDNNLLDSIKSAKNFILVLSPNALDRCIGDDDCKDWVHKEIVAALASNCNIIPILDNFHWPDPDQLPEDMRSITYFNGVRWIHDYQDACVDKVERFIRGELNNVNTNSSIISGSSCSTNQQQQQVQNGQQKSIPTNIPSTPSIHCTNTGMLTNAINPGQPTTPSLCSTSVGSSLTRNYQTNLTNNPSGLNASNISSPMLNNHTHPSESDGHPLALALSDQAGKSSFHLNHQLTGSLSNGPSNYRLR